MADNVRVRLIIHGRVQGVFYRLKTQQAAERIGVTGWVRNLPDGTVEALVEGGREDVAALVDWCRQGPPMSRVDDIRITDQAFSGEFDRFSVRY